MNGPEHYREAGKWAGTAAEWWPQDQEDAPTITQAAAAIAQVHATLALAAATATAHITSYTTGEREAWRAIQEVTEP